MEPPRRDAARPHVATALAAAFALSATPAGATAPGQDRPDQRRLETAAVELLNTATNRVRKRHPICRPKMEHTTAPAVTPGPIGAPYTDVLSIFRRAPTPQELEAAGETRTMAPPNTEAVFAEGVRNVVAADGTQLTVRLLSRVGRLGPAPATQRRCDAWTRALLRGNGAKAERARKILADNRARGDAGFEPGPWLLLGHRGGSGGGPFDLKRFTERGNFLSMGSGPGRPANGRPAHSRLLGVVPDGVASVVLDYPRYASRGPNRRALDHGAPFQVTTPVKDNVLAVDVPRDAGDTLGGATMTWLGPDGATVRVVKPEQ